MRSTAVPVRKPVTVKHDDNVTVFRQIMVVSGPRHDVEMTLVTTVRYDDEGLIESFLVEPEDQGVFDYVIDTSSISEKSS